MELVNYLFGSLPKSYCSLFFYISVVAFLQLVLLIGSYLISIVRDNKLASNPMFHVGGFLMLVSYAIIYFQNRMLHSMCIHSL